MLALGLLATLGFGRVVRARLAAIETSAGAIMAGDLAARMPVDGSGSEFDRLSTVLNRMLDRIGDLLGNLRQVSGDIAHDLRTPLQRIRGKLERMADRAEGSAFETPLAESLRDTDDRLELFEALLAISEIEGQSVRARFAVFDLHEAVGEMAELYRPTIEEAGRTLTFKGEPASVPGDRKLVQQAVANLLDNALIHAVPSSRIDIAVEIAGENAVLTISDDGPGIASADHERIFQRLVRLDASRATPGHGLGLSLVSAIAAAHRGSVTASTGARGLGVRLLLPVAKAGA